MSTTSLFVNHTGSSETSGFAWYHVPFAGPIPEGQVPSGLPLGERELSLRREDGTEAEGSEPGELFVTSRFVSLGYWGQSVLTAEKFETLDDGRRRYRTGDVAARRADGTLEHRGRRDQMVKVRGYLVEPSEVEAALLATGEVTAAAVLGLTEPGAAARLVAYVVPVGPETTVASVRHALRQRVPTYMVPNSVVMVADLPRNPNGKVDRMALHDLPVPAPAPPVAPRDDVELRLAVAWADILGVEAIGVDDDFFELGGDSLAAETAMAALKEDFGVSLPTSVLLDAPTVAELAAQVRQPGGRRTGDHPTLVALRKSGARPPLFCVSGVGGLALMFLPLSLRLGPDQPLYVFENQGLENRGLPDFTITSAARRAVRAIRSVQPSGPYLLAGHSWGGLVAYEIARQLTAAGDEVAFLGLIDVTDDRYPGESPDDPGPVRAPGAAPESALRRVHGWWEQLGVVRRVVKASLSGASAHQGGRRRLLPLRADREPSLPATAVEGSGHRRHRHRESGGARRHDVGRHPGRRAAAILSVAGDHKTMLREPNVPSLADVLTRQIEVALGAERVGQSSAAESLSR